MACLAVVANPSTSSLIPFPIVNTAVKGWLDVRVHHSEQLQLTYLSACENKSVSLRRNPHSVPPRRRWSLRRCDTRPHARPLRFDCNLLQWRANTHSHGEVGRFLLLRVSHCPCCACPSLSSPRARPDRLPYATL